MSTCLQHRHVPKWKVSEACDVQKADFVCALIEVPASQIHRLPQISDVPLRCGLISDIILVPLCHHKIALIIGSDIQAGDDSPCQSAHMPCNSPQLCY